MRRHIVTNFRKFCQGGGVICVFLFHSVWRFGDGCACVYGVGIYKLTLQVGRVAYVKGILYEGPDQVHKCILHFSIKHIMSLQKQFTDVSFYCLFQICLCSRWCILKS